METTESLFQQLMELDSRYDDPNLTDSDRQELDQAWQELQERLHYAQQVAAASAVGERPPTPIPREEELLDDPWTFSDPQDCAQCPGCMFCEERGYDGSDEV